MTVLTIYCGHEIYCPLCDRRFDVIKDADAFISDPDIDTLLEHVYRDHPEARASTVGSLYRQPVLAVLRTEIA